MPIRQQAINQLHNENNQQIAQEALSSTIATLPDD
jgi:hypothetical protein